MVLKITIAESFLCSSQDRSYMITAIVLHGSILVVVIIIASSLKLIATDTGKAIRPEAVPKIYFVSAAIL